MAGIVNDTKQTAQQIAQKIAKQVAQEPIEILKQAGEQVAGTQEQGEGQTQDVPPQEGQTPVPASEVQLKQKLQVQGQRQLQALETEIKEIRQKKEQKEIAEEQEEAVQKQQEEQTGEAPPQVSSKPSRRFGQKQAAQKEATRVEKPLPPSG
jgi:serine phosphatase RsbU (regulator of sigma subunit)